MPDLSTTASFFEAPARAAGSTAVNASGGPSASSNGVGAANTAGEADNDSVFANLILADQQQQPETPAPDTSQLLAGDGPATQSQLVPGNGEGLFGAGLHPGESGLEQAIDADGQQQTVNAPTPIELLAEPGSGAVGSGETDVDGPVLANASNAGSLPAQNNGNAGNNALPDDLQAINPPAHQQAAVGPPALADNATTVGDIETAPPGAIAKPVSSILNGQSETDDNTGGDGENGEEPGITAGPTSDASDLSGQSQTPIAGPESTPGAAAKAIAWSLAPQQGALGAASAPGNLGTPGAPNGNAANSPEFTPFPPGAANGKGPAAPGATDPTGDAKEASAKGNENPASENRSPVADARNHNAFAQLLNSQFGERPGSPSSSTLGTPELPVFASPAGMASPVVRAAFQPTSGEPPTLPVRAIAVHIAQRFDNGERRFDIRLDPPELGRIDVRMEIGRDGQVTARLTADYPETLDALQRDARGLERALQTAGLDTGEDGLSFHLREQQSDEHHASSDGANPEGEDDPLATDEALPGRIVSLTAIDIRV